MSNNEYEHRHLFCEKVKMKKQRIKLSFSIFNGISFGVVFPLNYYADCAVSFLCFVLYIKWRKR